jgi:hypothetical protein
MARPRIFISSTFFDLRTVRNDIERFIKEMGYEPVLFERGQVPYSKSHSLETECYKELTHCDIIVVIIGGKYGSESRDKTNSITQNELKTAVEAGKQLYTFVDKAVHGEYNTYLRNKDVNGFQPATVDNIKVFEFIDEVYKLPYGNPIFPFELPADIMSFLQEQWAGLFQRLLQQTERIKEVEIIQDLKDTSSTLKQLISQAASLENISSKQSSIDDILRFNHPAFSAIKKALKIPFRVVFVDLRELQALLRARQFIEDKNPIHSDVYEWDNHEQRDCLQVNKCIFELDGRLKIFTPQDWDDTWIRVYDPYGKEEIPF